MTFPGAHKPSLVILGRTTLVLVVLCVALVSFAVGYLVGYQVMPLATGEQPVLGKPDTPRIISSDEKRVLEPAPLSTGPQPPQSVQAEKQPEPLVSIKPSAPEAATGTIEQSAPPPQKPATAETKKPAPKAKQQEAQKPADAKQDKQETALKPEKGAPYQPANTPNPVASQSGKNSPAEVKKTIETQKASAKKAAKRGTPVKGSYAVQFGAFVDASKASALKSELAKKGVKAYVVTKDKKTKYSRVRAGRFTTYAEAANYASATAATTGFASFVTKR